MADLTFDILARDRASRVLKNVGDSADSLAGKLNKLDGVKAGILATGVPALAGATGLILGAAGAAAVLAPALGAVKLATQGVGDAWSASTEKGEEYQAMLDDLSPSAAATVQEATQLREAWGSVGDAVQEGLFSQIKGDLTELSGNIIPTLKQDLPDVAEAMGRAASAGMEWAGSADTIERVSTIIRGSVPVIDDFGDSLVDIADTWTILGAGAVPVAQEIATSLNEITSATRGWAQEAERTGELDAIFNSTSTTVDLLFQNIQNLGTAIGNLGANPAAINALNDFLEVATSLTGGIAALTGAFASLPPGLQEFILVGAGAAVAGSKLYGMYESLTSRARAAATAQDDVSKSTSRFQNAANAVTVAGGRMVAILGGMQIASALYSTTQNESGVSTSKLQQSLLEYAKTGEATGEMLDVFKGKTENLNDAFKSLDTTGFAGFSNGLASVIEGLTGTGAVFDSSMENHKKRLAELDTAIAGLVQSGNADAARQILAQLAEDAKKNGTNLSELNAALPQTNALLGDLEAAANTTSQAEQLVSAQTQLLTNDFNTAVTAVGGLENAFKILNSTAQTTNSTFSGYQAALDQITAANVNAKAGFDLTTEAGRQNYAMLEQAVVALQNYASAANLTGPEIEALRQDIINQGVAAGIGRDQMTSMVNSILQIPGSADPAANSVKGLQDQISALKSKQVEVKESGSADSSARVKALQAQINALQDKYVRITTEYIQRTTVISGSGEPARRAGGAYRWGGVQMYAAQSGLVANIARPGTLYQWAEPATGGEAFIPRKGNTERSRDILKYVAEEWLGGPEAIWGGQRQYSSGPTASNGGSAFGGGTDASMIVRAIRDLGSLIENMGISIDGQALGRAQGRRTLLEQFGG